MQGPSQSTNKVQTVCHRWSQWRLTLSQKLAAFGLLILVSLALLAASFQSTVRQERLWQQNEHLSKLIAFALAGPLVQDTSEQLPDQIQALMLHSGASALCLFDANGQLNRVTLKSYTQPCPDQARLLNNPAAIKPYWHTQPIVHGSKTLGTLATYWAPVSTFWPPNHLLFSGAVLLTALLCSLLFYPLIAYRFTQPLRSLRIIIDKATRNNTFDDAQMRNLRNDLNTMNNDGHTTAIRPLLETLITLTEQLTAQHKALKAVALSDPLTGLPNRRHYFKHLQTALHRLKRTRKPLAVMLIDLDGFKPVNDLLGHEVGDALLIEISKVLRGTVRREDFISRFGGDEFTIIVQECETPQIVQRIAQSVLAALNQPLIVAEHRINIGASIGISLAPQDSMTPLELTRQADQAMYGAKNIGKNQIIFWNTCLNSFSMLASQEETLLMEALNSGTVDLTVQPQTAFTRPNAIIGVRIHPLIKNLGIKGQFQPSRSVEQIIQHCSNPRLLLAYYRWLIEALSNLTAQCLTHDNTTHHPLPLTVSLTPHKTQVACFLQAFKTAVKTKKLNPKHILLHLQERALDRLHHLPLGFIQNQENQQLLTTLRLCVDINPPQDGQTLLGKIPNQLFGRIQISALDYPSLTQQEADPKNPEAHATVSAITALAERFNCQVFVTDIDTPTAWNNFSQYGITGAQGTYCAATLSQSQFLTLLSRASNNAEQSRHRSKHKDYLL